MNTRFRRRLILVVVAWVGVAVWLLVRSSHQAVSPDPTGVSETNAANIKTQYLNLAQNKRQIIAGQIG
jgi:hypothetical protein